MAPGEIWNALGVSRQGAMDLLRPLIDAGLVEKVGGKKTGYYALRKPWTKLKPVSQTSYAAYEAVSGLLYGSV
jgi:predicted transcriptional regulator